MDRVQETDSPGGNVYNGMSLEIIENGSWDHS